MITSAEVSLPDHGDEVIIRVAGHTWDGARGEIVSIFSTMIYGVEIYCDGDGVELDESVVTYRFREEFTLTGGRY